MKAVLTALVALCAVASVSAIITPSGDKADTPSCRACNALRQTEHDVPTCIATCSKLPDIPQKECTETCHKLNAISRLFSDRVTDPCNTIGHCIKVVQVPLRTDVNTTTVPIVMMHGFNSNASSMELFDTWTTRKYPGIYVKNVEIGDGQLTSVFMSMDKQVQNFCDQIAADENLKNGFDLLGFSQGTVLTRGFIERCNTPGVRHWVSLAGINGGIFGAGFVPPWIDPAIATTPYVEWIQNTFTFAQYWKDPFNLTAYIDTSLYLADLNNERAVKNPDYRQRIESLEKCVLIYSSEDDIVRPRPSGIFSFYANNSDTTIVPYEETTSFAENWLGFNTLHKSGRLYIYITTCLHSEHHTETCYNYFEKYILPFLGARSNFVEPPRSRHDVVVAGK